MKKIKTNIPVWCIGIFLALSAGSCASDQDRFPGLWKLHIIERADPETGQYSEWNNGAQGYLLYDDQGHMAVHITTKDYAEVDFDLPFAVDSLSVAALKHRTKSITYFANYQLSESQGTVAHARMTHTNPQEWNVIVTRNYHFLGDTLVLAPTEAKYSGLRLKWIKN